MWPAFDDSYINYKPIKKAVFHLPFLKIYAYNEAVKWFTLAAKKGNADAQFHLGDCYARGTGVEWNWEEAVKWFTLAAEKGQPLAKRHLEESEILQQRFQPPRKRRRETTQSDAWLT